MTMVSKSSANDYIAQDKQKHLIAGVAIYSTCIAGGYILKAMSYENNWLTPVNCLAPVIIAGAGKEIYDYNNPQNHTAEFADFAYTVAVPIMASFVITKF